MADSSYLIIGAGCFGASTARALKDAYPTADVVLLDQQPFPAPAAAAHDFNKIIRAEYEDPVYMALALEAREAWAEKDPVVEPFFHQTGVIWPVTQTRAKKLREGYDGLIGEGKAPLQELSFEEAKTKFPVLGGCGLDGDGEAELCVFNPLAGWAEAAGALEAVVRDTLGKGVKYEVATAKRLIFDNEGVCTGVLAEDGRTFTAENVILSAGAYIPWLLAESAPEKPEVQAGDRMVAASALMGLFKVPPGEKGLDKFTNAPIIVHSFGEYPAECIPPGSPGALDLAKCTHELPYTRKVYHEPTKQDISVPPLSQAERMKWTTDLPDALKANSAGARNKLFGDHITGMAPEIYRLCWDVSTPDENWIISPHPAVKNLYITTGGSFHAFKFLPNIGKYVVQMLQGKLSEEHTRKWAWNREITPIVSPYTPRADLRNVPGYHD
ncbi:sarcosine oxidase [Hypoxylon trugodes]|uniref:sarcosine oxidase n=1 Tax=Hypoxylon trugodes TaxID=326681 RepID=UPI00219FFBBB|nr:sarcosine oxidase [Hypoxylon trugodes]KAI1387908.1 sarcosine oxidase [Hypoxylon trugodes]